MDRDTSDNAILLALAWCLVLFMAGLLFGCSYTAPASATPDLVEKLSNGHTICYYRQGLDRGYAKCCPDCPKHKTEEKR